MSKEIKTRTFEYTKQESYSQEDIERTLSQHNEFVANGFKGYVAPEQVEIYREEIKSFSKNKEEQVLKDKELQVLQAAEKLVPKERANALIKLTNVLPNDIDGINAALQETLKENSFLSKATSIDPTIIQGNKDIKPNDTDNKPSRKFVIDWKNQWNSKKQ